MIRLEDVKSRIAEKLPAFADQIGFATQFNQVIEKQMFPGRSPWIFVLPGDIVAESADAMTGLFRQGVNVGVQLTAMVRVAGDTLGGKAVDEIGPLIKQLVEAVLGWCPAGATGDFELQRAGLSGSASGWIFYDIVIAVDDQLRINPT